MAGHSPRGRREAKPIETSSLDAVPAPTAERPAPAEPEGPVESVPMAESFIFGIVAMGLLNGLFSPMLGYAVILHPLWYPTGFLPGSPSFLFMFASLMVSTLTIMVAGVPAAVYERFVSRGKTTVVSLWIWVSVLAILTMPAALRGVSLL